MVSSILILVAFLRFGPTSGTLSFSWSTILLYELSAKLLIALPEIRPVEDSYKLLLCAKFDAVNAVFEPVKLMFSSNGSLNNNSSTDEASNLGESYNFRGNGNLRGAPNRVLFNPFITDPPEPSVDGEFSLRFTGDGLSFIGNLDIT